MRFSATEVGFENGMGGASNAAGQRNYHYVLFGVQEDDQNPDNNGVYFEFDDQINGSVNSVNQIAISSSKVDFVLIDGTLIRVMCQASAAKWKEFLDGIKRVFQAEQIRDKG
jgi:hypothetical protein